MSTDEVRLSQQSIDALVQALRDDDRRRKNSDTSSDSFRRQRDRRRVSDQNLMDGFLDSTNHTKLKNYKESVNKTEKALDGMGSGVKKVISQTKKLVAPFAYLAEITTGFVSDLATFGRDTYGPLQKTFGGLRDLANISNESSAQAVKDMDMIHGAGLNAFGEFHEGQNAIMVEALKGSGKTVNAYRAFLEGGAQEAHNNYLKAVTNQRRIHQLQLNRMDDASKARLGVYLEGFQTDQNKIDALLNRQIAMTGKASDEIFREVAAFSDAVAKKTGVDFQTIAGLTIDIQTDIKRFGNVTSDEASRIAGALGQIGLSFDSFGSMIDNFTGFDSAAESLGNLTTVFGVHFDAMEMMMLANEDQEEFLYRMREAFLDTGLAVEDMTHAQKRLAAEQLGMNITEFQTFMDEGRLAADGFDMAEATGAAQVEKGFQVLTDNMELIPMTGDKILEYFNQKFFFGVRQGARKLATELDFLSHVATDFEDQQAYIREGRSYGQGYIRGLTLEGADEKRLYLDQLNTIAAEKLAADEDNQDLIAAQKKIAEFTTAQKAKKEH
tara:strand:+ start:611 stop:2269 length:1659 start_codon:yes stop_codon:yes gene_type:complete